MDSALGGDHPGPEGSSVPHSPLSRRWWDSCPHAAQAGNGAPGEGVAQYTQCRGEACKSRGAGQSPGRGPRAGHVPWTGRPGPGLDDGALLALEGGVGGRPGQQQLLLVDQLVQ